MSLRTTSRTRFVSNQKRPTFCRYLLVSAMSLIVVFVSAENSNSQNTNSQIPSSKTVDFGKEVRPIFETHCFSCHGPNRQESNFRLDVRKLALAEADMGEPSIVVGDSKSSPLIQFVSPDADIPMPPEGEGKRLSKTQIETLQRWIDQGAKWPDQWAGDESQKITTDHWAFQPIRHIAPPTVKEQKLREFVIANSIDQFIAARLQPEGIQPSVPADKRSLVRRLYATMHGMKPTPEQMETFVNNESGDAYSELVTQVLASHHYGERWARHWLDVVRFGESTGYEVNRDRENAYYYRDYVIDSFNNDKPYNEFVVEQIAGDAIGVDEATGFLVGGPYDIVKSPDINLTLMQREDELADYVNTTSTTFLALTVGCARCHNHKFDPILQRDYYAMQAIFAGVAHGERQMPNKVDSTVQESIRQTDSKLNSVLAKLTVLRKYASAKNPSRNLLDAVNGKSNTDEFESTKSKYIRFEILATNSVEPCLDELEVFSTKGINVALASNGSVATSSGDYQGNPKHKLKHINDGKFGNEFSWISNTAGTGWIQIEFSKPVEISRVVWGRDRNAVFADRLAIDYSVKVSMDGSVWNEVSNANRRKPFNGRESDDAFINRLPKEKIEPATKLLAKAKELQAEKNRLSTSIPIGYVGTFKKPKTIHRLYRGDPMSPKEAVPPDTLTVMGSLDLSDQTPEQGRRVKFAQWLTNENNPLTARVIVNRVWHYHFGQGIVETPSDFGINGRRPSHPELLDWLAREFMNNGWSLKWLHRQILSSSTYRQSSAPRAKPLAIDADSKLLWRFPPRRMEAEAIRDCVLQVSGKLNLKAGGPGFLLFKINHENVHHYFPLEEFNESHFRRMIYMTKIRQEQDDVFGAFDCPDGGQTIPNRTQSTTALQALNLLNSKFMLEQADFFAARLKQSSEDIRVQATLAFELAFLRPATKEEVQDSVQFIEKHGLKAFCRAIFNSNEFLYVS
ncbi:MAG: DUF1553 domain-containing protein [Mariniblastus sp.]